MLLKEMPNSRIMAIRYTQLYSGTVRLKKPSGRLASMCPSPPARLSDKGSSTSTPRPRITNCTKSVTATAHSPPMKVYASMITLDQNTVLLMSSPRNTERKVLVATILRASSMTRTGRPCQAKSCRTELL